MSRKVTSVPNFRFVKYNLSFRFVDYTLSFRFVEYKFRFVEYKFRFVSFRFVEYTKPLEVIREGFSVEFRPNPFCQHETGT